MSLLLLLAGGVGTAADDIDFERDIRPLLRDRCGDCHGPDLQEAQLRLDVRHRAFKGSEFGPVIIPGNGAESLLITRVTHPDTDERMPPEEPLSTAEIRLLQQWIDTGAVWPESARDRIAREEDHDPRLQHWAWQPVVRPEVPAATWLKTTDSQNPIDRFLAAALQRAGLAPAGTADRRTLIRRLSFDLLGLPPSPQAVAAFVADTSPTAYATLVEAFLASPHFGERQARHWLDIAHYADTHGFERDQIRETAWRYRDWLIRAFNDDLPYNEFLKRQIAGDVIAPHDPAFTVASGFLTAGPWDYVGQVETKSGVLRRQARADDLDDMITQVMTAACGITINCARCHDHKIDPIAQTEYYAIAAVFAGVTRGERSTNPAADARAAAEKKRLNDDIAKARATIQRLSGRGLDLADIVGGGNGYGSGLVGAGIHPLSGVRLEASPMGFLESVIPNAPQPGPTPPVAAVFVPTGPDPVPITTDGLMLADVPATSTAAWDAIRNGPVNSQHATTLDGIDYADSSHTMLGLHANAGITFDLHQLGLERVTTPIFRCVVGYGGKTPLDGADYTVALDGIVVAHGRLGRDDGGVALEVPLPTQSRYLTLIATDAGNGISHDQLIFGDPRIAGSPSELTPSQEKTFHAAQQTEAKLSAELAHWKPAPTFYGPVAHEPVAIHRLTRGNPENPAEEVDPAALRCITNLSPQLVDAHASDAERRLAFATWISDAAHPLTARVIVNRLWQHHFGTGLVDTPSDFGLGGSMPSHPLLLDWLAAELVAHNWSLKHIHRLICTSQAYRRQSRCPELAATAQQHDTDNRLLWRQNPRRLDAESLRDATLAASGCLNLEMFGPGYRDFTYQEAYAPVYTYITADNPDLWRRTIYRFVVRSTPSQFLTTLDCPNPANLTPVRLQTTTPLQSLALLNNDFLLRQSAHFAALVQAEASEPLAQAQLGFARALQRPPDEIESRAAVDLINTTSLTQFCRMLLNTNEFVTID